MIILTNPPYFPFASGSFRVSSPFGSRGVSFHNGIDLVDTSRITNTYHNAIMAVMPGRVIQARQVTDKNNKTWEWGKYVSILQDDGNTAYYCHLAKILVKAGDIVEAGDLIGIQGSTGLSTGSHLHFELRSQSGNVVKILNPADYLDIINATGTTVEWGYDYEAIVMEKCGLEEQTRKYINNYRYAEDLWRKIAEHLK